MSLETIAILLPVLAFALVGTAVLRALRNRGGGAGSWTQRNGTIVSSRLGDNSMGSVDEYYPIIDVSYQRDGQTVSATNLAVARETKTDLAQAKALIAGPYAPGQPIVLLEDPAAPGRVTIR